MKYYFFWSAILIVRKKYIVVTTFFLKRWEHFRSTFSKFQVNNAVLTIVATLCVGSPETIHRIMGSLLPFYTTAPCPPPAAPGDHPSPPLVLWVPCFRSSCKWDHTVFSLCVQLILLSEPSSQVWPWRNKCFRKARSHPWFCSTEFCVCVPGCGDRNASTRWPSRHWRACLGLKAEAHWAQVLKRSPRGCGAFTLAFYLRWRPEGHTLAVSMWKWMHLHAVMWLFWNKAHY